MKIKRDRIIFRNLFRFTILFFIFLSGNSLSAEVTVRFQLPELGEGMAQLEALLAENIGPAISEMEILVNETLDKPELTRAFGSAVSLSSSMPMLGTLPLASRYSFSLGGYTALYSYTLDVDTLTGRFSELDPEEDFAFGASAQVVNANMTFPLNRLLPGLTLFTSAGFSDLAGEEYYLKDVFAQVAFGYPLFREVKKKGFFRWTPLYVQAGTSYGYNRIGAKIAAGQITESFELDPDGSGPLPGQDVTIQVDPVVDVGMASHVGNLSLSLTTGISLLDSFHFYIGSGCNVSFGRTDIAVSSSEEIIVLGYLADLIEEPGAITIDGAVEGSPPKALLAYFFTGLQFDISKMFINIPFLYHPAAGLSAGISLGVSL